MIIIMYFYHALFDTLSAHLIHINLNTIFYTHMEQSPTNANYIKYYMMQKTRTTTNCNESKPVAHNYVTLICTYACTHAHTHTLTVAKTGY